MLKRALYLYLISIKSFFHRLRYDLIEEFITGISAVVLMATFLYVFNDFLNDKVSAISLKMRDFFGEAAAYFTVFIGIVISVKFIRFELYEKYSLKTAVKILGESPEVIRIFVFLRIISILLVVFGLSWLLISSVMINWKINEIILVQGVALIVVFIIILFPYKEPSVNNKVDFLKGNKEISSSLTIKSQSQIKTLYFWRIKQIFLRNRASVFSLLLSGVFVVFTLLNFFWKGPYFFSIILSFSAGCFASCSLAFQLKEDLSYAWIERTFGVSHQRFLMAYHLISLTIGCIVGGAVFLSITVFELYNGLDIKISNNLKLFIIGALCPIIMPYLFMQIDGRKPALGIITTFLIGLFLATAIYAHWLGLILLLILKYYGRLHQEGRFYRA